MSHTVLGPTGFIEGLVRCFKGDLKRYYMINKACGVPVLLISNRLSRWPHSAIGKPIGRMRSPLLVARIGRGVPAWLQRRRKLFCGKISLRRRDAQRFALRVGLTRGQVGCHPRFLGIDLSYDSVSEKMIRRLHRLRRFRFEAGRALELKVRQLRIRFTHLSADYG
jgi:hypothetical protein